MYVYLKTRRSLLVSVYLATFLFLGLFYSTALADDQFPGSTFPSTIEGTGTYFEITGSEYLNVSLDSSEEIKLRIESIPEMITMLFETLPSANFSQSQITISGLTPLTIYYKFEDDYHNQTIFVTDGNGKYTYFQDLLETHLVFIQPRKSTKFIKDNATGGDCGSIGTWNWITKTCTLTTDVNETIQIDNNDIALDGNGHTISGTNTGSGIYVSSKNGVAVKNLNINNFSNAIFFYNTNQSNIENIWASGNTYGITVFQSSELFFLNNNVINNTFRGMLIAIGSSNLTLKNNTMSGNQYSNFSLDTFAHGGFGHDIDKSNTVEGRPIYYIENGNNEAFDGLTDVGVFYCINCNNMTLKNFTVDTVSNGTAMFLWNTDDSIIENINVSNANAGIDFRFSDGNTISRSAAYNNIAGIALGNLSANNIFYNNNFIENNLHIWFSDAGANTFNLPASIGGNYWDDFDEPGEGCNDTNSDGFCDAPYIHYGGQDNLPWVVQDGWVLPTTQDINIAVILAESANTPYDSNPALHKPCKLLPSKYYHDGHGKDYYNDLAYCVSDYHKENSFEIIDLDFTIYDNDGDWFKTSRNEEDYVGKEDEFVVDAINLAISTGIDLSGEDIVIVVHSGTSYQKEHNRLWNPSPQKISTCTWTPNTQPLGCPSYKIIVAEDDLVGGWTHEIGHIIGMLITSKNTAIPDLSHRDILMGHVEKWDLMARGSLNDGGNNPPYMSSYTKEFLKWLDYDIHPKSAYGEYWINSLGTSEFGDSVFRYNLSNDTDDKSSKYYILEVRDKNLKTWDSSLPGLSDENLILYFVDTKKLPEYGYVPEGTTEYQKDMVWNQYRIVTIPGNSLLTETINDGILNPLFNETYRDLDNLVKFTAITDRTINDKYEIQAKIKEIKYDSFSDKFWGVVLRSGTFLKQKIKTTPTIFSPAGSSEFINNNIDSSKNGQLGMPLKRSGTMSDVVVGIAGFFFWLSIPLSLLSLLLLCLDKIIISRLKSGQKRKGIKVIFRTVWLTTIISLAFLVTCLLLVPILEKIEPTPPSCSPGVLCWAPLAYSTSPDLDLHLYCDDGKHIGINYESDEYEIQIEEAIVSGDNQGAPEWIFVPADMTNCHFVVSSLDNHQFLTENPEIAQEIEDTTDSYDIYARYIDPVAGIYTSQIAVNQIINSGEFVEHQIIGTDDIVVGEREITIDSVIVAIHQYHNSGWIDSLGVKTSLIQKLESTKKNLDKNKVKTAKNILEAIINEIEAQSGKHIDSDIATILIKNVEYIIEQIRTELSDANPTSQLSFLLANLHGAFFSLLELLSNL